MEKKTFIVTVSSTYSDVTYSIRVYGTFEELKKYLRGIVKEEVEEASFDDEEEYYNRYNFYINKDQDFISKTINFIGNRFTLIQAELDNEPIILS